MNFHPGDGARMVSERLLRTIHSAYLLNVLGRVADAVFFLILFERLSVDNVGLFSSVMAIAAFIGAVMDFGLSQVLVREFSRRTLTFREAVNASFLIRIPLILVGLLVFIIWVWHSDPLFEQYAAIGIAGVIQFLLVSEGLVQAWLKANYQQSTSNKLAFLDPVGRCLTISLLVIASAHVSVTQLLLALLIIHIVIMLVHVSIAVRFTEAEGRIPGVSACDNRISTLLHSGGVFALISLISVIQNRADWLLLSYFAGSVDLANYALANKLYEILLAGLGVAVVTTYPWLCSLKRKRLRSMQIDIILNMVLATGVTLSFAAALYLPTLITTLFDEKYELAKPLIQTLLPLAAISTYVLVRYYEMLSRGMERSLLKYTAYATILQLAVNGLLIPHFGVMGSVTGMAALVITTFVLYMNCSARHGILRAEKLLRELTYLIIMAFFSFALWLLGVNIRFGLFSLLLFGAIAAMYVLLAPRSKVWLTCFFRRKNILLFRGTRA